MRWRSKVTVAIARSRSSRALPRAHRIDLHLEPSVPGMAAGDDVAAREVLPVCHEHRSGLSFEDEPVVDVDHERVRSRPSSDAVRSCPQHHHVHCEAVTELDGVDRQLPRRGRLRREPDRPSQIAIRDGYEMHELSRVSARELRERAIATVTFECHRITGRDSPGIAGSDHAAATVPATTTPR